MDGDWQLGRQGALKLLAAFEMYSDTHLQWADNGPSWGVAPPLTPPTPSPSDELALLREQVRLLTLAAKPATLDTLRQCTTENLERFLQLPNLDPLFHRLATTINLAHADSSPTPTMLAVAAGHVQTIWEAFLQLYFHPTHGRSPAPGAISIFRPGASQGFATKARPAPYTLASIREKGGTLDTVSTPYGVIATFADVDGKRFYVSKKGQFWDVAYPPPALCNTCQAAHWFWEC